MKRPGGFDGGPAAEEPQRPARSREQGEAKPAREPREFRRVRRPGDPVRLPVGLPEAAPSDVEPSARMTSPGSEDAVVSELPTQDLSDLAGVSRPADEAPAELAHTAALPRDSVKAAERELKRATRSVRNRERREQRRFTAHIRRRRRGWLIGIGAVLGLALFVAIGVLSPLTAVREVQVVGAKQVDEAKLGRALQRFDGVPLVLVQQSEVHRALEPFPLIQRYSVERIPPHTLLIRIEERDAVLAVPLGKGVELRDPAGVLLGTADAPPRGVPVAKGRAKDPGTPAFTAAARVVRDLPNDLRKKLTEVSASSAQDVAFLLTDGKRVIWGEATETQRKAVVLRAMLKSVKSASVIDVSAPQTPVFH